MGTSQNKGGRVMSSKLERVVQEVEQKQGKPLDTGVVTCDYCGISGMLKEVLIRDEPNKAIIRCKNCGVGERFQFKDGSFVKEIEDKSHYTSWEILGYLLLRAELNREIQDERIANVLASLAAPAFGHTRLSYFSNPKKFEAEVGTLSADLYSISAEIPFHLMVSLVEEVLKNGRNELNIQTRLWGSADNSLYRDIQTAECTGEVTISLDLAENKPSLGLSAPEFYEKLCSL